MTSTNNNKDKNKIDNSLPIPLEFQKQLSKILTDSPSLVKIGKKEFKVKGLRMYSIERIFQIAQELKAFDKDNVTEALKYIATNLDAQCKIVAIVLCNHLFDEEQCNFNTFDEMLDVQSRNDKLIEMMAMKAKLCSDNHLNEFASIVISAFNELDLGELFQLASLVMIYSESASMRHQRNIETLSIVQQAGLDKCQTGSKRIQLGQKGTTSISSQNQK